MCGNWGVLCLREFLQSRNDRTPVGVLPSLIEALIRGMIGIIEMRGAQAGGLNLMQTGADQKVQQCRIRALKPKRGDLGQTLFDKVRHEHRWARLKGGLREKMLGRCFDPSSQEILLQGHSRFGTSSPPAVMETHPHQWSPTTNCAFWSWNKDCGWHRRICSYTLCITHNGDFDAWTPYRKTTLGVSDLHLWLQHVLAVRNSTSGDSPNIAGVLELLACQGMWYQSVRQAYHLHVAQHVQQACGWMPLSMSVPSTVPDRHTLTMFADVMEKQFENLVAVGGEGNPMYERDLLADAGGRLNEFVEDCIDALSLECGELLHKWVSPNKVRQFVVAAIEGFRDNDLMSVTSAFLQRAEGTFGISVTSSLTPHVVVLAARGQPMSIGFGGCCQAGYPTAAFWSSEPAALQALNKDEVLANKRLDLDDQIGEVVELCMMHKDDWTAQADQFIEGGGVFPISFDTSSMAEECPEKVLMIRGLDFTNTEGESAENWNPTLMTFESFQDRLIPIHQKMQSQGPSMLATDARKGYSGFGGSKDCVAKDIEHIPWLVREIDTTWSNQDSLNRISSDNFALKLLKILSSKQAGAWRGVGDKGPGARIDLVVFGVETSLWLGQQFVADLQRLFPSLNVVAMSSNVLLGLLQRGAAHVNPSNWTYSEDSFDIDKDTLGLALSHSGTTYPTVWAARLLRSHTKNVFALSSAFDGLLACSIGQSPNQKFAGLLFSTQAGIRPAEAATVATVAMHHTLSHLLLQCAAVAAQVKLPSLQAYSRRDIVEGVANDQVVVEEVEDQEDRFKICTASPSSVKDMQRLLLSMYWGVSSSCGIDGDGNESSGCHTELVEAGHRWSHHITEGYFATFVPAAYVVFTVIPGFLPVTEFGEWLSSRFDHDLDEYMFWLLRALDCFLYVFMGIIVAMVHRKLTGRRLWARFTTRTLLLVESTVNYKLLRAYTSKLVALSYRFATISVVGQNGADHMVHEYTHKAQSDVLLAVGLPDGRLPSTAPVEGCVLMSSSQAQFIKKRGHGVETYGMGHNTWTRPNLFVRAMKLPTFRPIFATEKMLFTDQLQSESGVAPGRHGTNPGAIVQSHKDMLKRNLDPYGMPPLRVTPDDLQSYMSLDEILDFKAASVILEDIISKHCLEAQVEVVPFGLPQFLSQFMSAHPGASRVYVHSPGKLYASPDKHYVSPGKLYASASPSREVSPGKSYASASALRQRSPGKSYAMQGSAAFLQDILSPKPSTANGTWSSTTNHIQEYLNKGSQAADDSETKKAAVHDSEAKELPSAVSLSSHLDANEFLALLHGDELQKWVRSARYRWHKICRMRGIISLLAQDHHIKKHESSGSDSGGFDRQVSVGESSSGLTILLIIHSWRKLAVKAAPPISPKKPGVPSVRTVKKAMNVQDASFMDASESERPVGRRASCLAVNASPAKKRSRWWQCGGRKAVEVDESKAAGGRLVCQELVDSGAARSEVLQQSRPIELFYEARVASAERLVGWFVLLHAMAKPSSRLPFLSYELGKSESRLRVASTPAPVPLHDLEGVAECGSTVCSDDHTDPLAVEREYSAHGVYAGMEYSAHSMYFSGDTVSTI